MREALQQKEQEQSMKTKMRQRVRPKLGKIDIDYQKLHDAFFRYQTKPKMSRHGDIYYEVIIKNVKFCFFDVLFFLKF